MTSSSVPRLPSNTGTTVPALGLGTYRLKGFEGVAAMVRALEAGYRLLDTAVSYDNEGAVGRAVRESHVPRDEIIVTSKLPGRFQDYDAALLTIEESVFRMGLERIDLYLIHWPNPRIDRYVTAWRALIEARRRGYVRDIGVSNFLPSHLERLIAETGVVPLVNQIEMHPYFPQTEQRAAHRRLGIITEAWTPLGRGNELLDDPLIVRIAASHGWSAAQTVLRWHTQLGAVPLPKAASPVRQRENLELFDGGLSEDELTEITALGRPDGRTAGQDPAVYESL